MVAPAPGPHWQSGTALAPNRAGGWLNSLGNDRSDPHIVRAVGAARARLHGIGSADGALCIGLSEAGFVFVWRRHAGGFSPEELLIGAATMRFVAADDSSSPFYNLSRH